MTKENKGGKWTSDLVLDLYANLLTEIWEVVSALIGETILELLFNLSIRNLKEKHPFFFKTLPHIPQYVVNLVFRYVRHYVADTVDEIKFPQG